MKSGAQTTPKSEQHESSKKKQLNRSLGKGPPRYTTVSAEDPGWELSHVSHPTHHSLPRAQTLGPHGPSPSPAAVPGPQNLDLEPHRGACPSKAHTLCLSPYSPFLLPTVGPAQPTPGSHEALWGLIYWKWDLPTSHSSQQLQNFYDTRLGLTAESSACCLS